MSSLHVYSGKGSIREKRGKSIKTKQKHVKEEEGKKKKSTQEPTLHESTTVIIFFFVVVWLRAYVSSASGKSVFFFSPTTRSMTMSAVEGRYAGKRETTRCKIWKRKKRNRGGGGKRRKRKSQLHFLNRFSVFTKALEQAVCFSLLLYYCCFTFNIGVRLHILQHAQARFSFFLLVGCAFFIVA